MTADFNLKIAHKERRKGYAKEAMLLFLDYFFNCQKVVSCLMMLP